MHKVFAGIAARGKTTKGWFYILKLHLIINRSGGIVKASCSSGNKDDRKQLQLMIKDMVKFLEIGDIFHNNYFKNC